MICSMGAEREPVFLIDAAHTLVEFDYAIWADEALLDDPAGVPAIESLAERIGREPGVETIVADHEVLWVRAPELAPSALASAIERSWTITPTDGQHVARATPAADQIWRANARIAQRLAA
jgi:hypothetical protein